MNHRNLEQVRHSPDDDEDDARAAFERKEREIDHGDYLRDQMKDREMDRREAIRKKTCHDVHAIRFVNIVQPTHHQP